MKNLLISIILMLITNVAIAGAGGSVIYIKQHATHNFSNSLLSNIIYYGNYYGYSYGYNIYGYKNYLVKETVYDELVQQKDMDHKEFNRNNNNVFE